MAAPVQTLRSDAARNRDALLAAAEEEFAEHGVAASVADIARRAGVAKGTMFRHFATKDQLITAVVVRYVDELIACARGLRDVDDAEAALFGFLTFAAGRRRQRDVTLLLSMSDKDPAVADVMDQLRVEIANLLVNAQKNGAVRPDVTGVDVFLIMCAPVHVVENLPGAPDDLWRRYLGLIFDGLRPAGASPLPRPAPEWS